MTLLSIKNLNLSFGDFEAVKNISFQLNPNEILGIVGESGSGKSVTALSILGLSRAKYGDQSSIMLKNQELIRASNAQMQEIRGSKIGFVFQEPMSSLNPLHKIGKQIAESILLHQKVSPDDAKRQSLVLLKRVGLKDYETRYNSYPHTLSGGERQRVMIAMAIANKPDILIADEPTTALDVTIQQEIIRLILDLKKEYGMSVIFISHDLKLVSKIADRIIVMQQGKIVETGRTKDLFSSPKKSYTKKLISSCNLLNNENKKINDIFLEAKHIDVKYVIKKNFFGKAREELAAVDDVSFKLYKGETLGIVGESGSGKTTLGLCVANLIKYHGNIDFSEIYKGKEFQKNVQIIFQDPYNSLNPRMTILDIIGEGLKVHEKQLSSFQIKEKVENILLKVGLKKEAIYKYPHEFSGGERQRIAIARAVILNPKLIVLDEPTSALDVTIQKEIISLLKDLQKRMGIAYIFISHDMRAIKAVSDRIIVMKGGKIIEIDYADQVFSNPKDKYTKALISASIF